MEMILDDLVGHFDVVCLQEIQCEAVPDMTDAKRIKNNNENTDFRSLLGKKATELEVHAFFVLLF